MAFVPVPGFADQTYRMRSQNLAVDRAINCYPGRIETGTGKGGKFLIGRPGLSTFATPTTGTGRALWAGDERMFGVVGTKSIEVSSGGAVTVLGDIGSGSSPCTIVTNNGTQLATLNPDTGILYVDTGAGPVAVAAQPTLFSAIAYLDGFLFGLAQDANAIFQSAQLDFTTWDVLDQATSVAANDRVATIYSDNQNLMVIGRKTTQFWYNSGAAGFVLQRIQGSFVQEGTCAPFSPASVNGVLCMVTGSERGAGRVVAVRPGRFDEISTDAIAYQLQSYSNLGEIVGYAYQSQGHDFYVITIPSAATQLVYDFTENAWHERYSGNATTLTESKAYLHCLTFDNKHYVMERASGKIYLQSETLNQDDGTSFLRQRTSPVLYANKRMSVMAFRTDQQIGDGSGTLGATLAASRDGGLSFDADRTVLSGANGLAGVVEWRNMGQTTPRGFVAKVSWTGGSDLACSGAWIDVREDAS